MTYRLSPAGRVAGLASGGVTAVAGSFCVFSVAIVVSDGPALLNAARAFLFRARYA